MSNHTFAVLAIAGAHNSGKTTLLEQLLPLLRQNGLQVAVIKHDGHDFTPDVPATDSYRLRAAGASGVAVFSQNRYLCYEERPLDEHALLAQFEGKGYDLVLLEGFKQSDWPKIEVVRSAISSHSVSRRPLAIVGDVPSADFALTAYSQIVQFIMGQMPSLQAREVEE